MANNYLQFCFEVEITNPEIKSWASDFLSYPEKHGKFEYDETGFDWDSQVNGLLIWDEENGDTENVIAFLVELLNQPGYTNNSVGFSYSYSSSKMRVGEFGGGAVKITKTPEGIDIKYIDTIEWLAG